MTRNNSMSKILLTFGLAVLAVASVVFAAGPGGPQPVRLEWDYPDDSAEVFKIYSHTNLESPLTNWGVLTNVAGTNRGCAVSIEAGRRFFLCTASNYWGESLPSNRPGLPAVVGTNLLRIVR